jgi:glycosyltransferase involved in cell wall biosynthesis
MRIALVLPHSQEEFGIASDAQYAKHDGYEHRYAKLLAKLGHEPTVCFLSNRRGVSEFTHTYGHRVVRVPLSVNLGAGRQVSLALLGRISREFACKQIDICHIMGYYPLQYDLFAVFCKLRGIPFIAQMHGGGRGATFWLRYPALFFTLRLAAAVLYVNPAERQRLARLFIAGEFFPNWADEAFANKRMRRKPHSLLFVGSMANEGRLYDKGADVLLEAFAAARREIKGLTLTVAGRCDDAWAKSAKQRFKGAIRILGSVSTRRLASLYNTHELCVLPSRFEPFSIVALESLSCGTPALITGSFGVAGFLRSNGYEMIADAGSAMQTAGLIVRAMQDKRFRKRNARIGAAVVKRHFSAERSGKRLVAIYRRVLRNARDSA